MHVRPHRAIWLTAALLLAQATMLLATASPAHAITVDGVPLGLQNGSFENGLNGWTATRFEPGEEGYTCPDPADPGYWEGCVDEPAVPAGVFPGSCTAEQLAGGEGHGDGICVVGTDTFTVTSEEGWPPYVCPDDPEDPDYWEGCVDDPGQPAGLTNVSVSPLDGSSMLRLGGPFLNSWESQTLSRLRVDQTFIVDPASPVLPLNYNVMTYDYQGYDELRVRVRITDEDGDVIAEEIQGAFGPGWDTQFKTTGWRSAQIDLTGYENEQVHLRIDAGGTQDHLFGFWVYIDAGVAPPSPVESIDVDPPTMPGGGTPNFDVMFDEATDQTWIVFSQSDADEFPIVDGAPCMPVPLKINISAGGGTISNAELIANNDNGTVDHVPLEGPPGGGLFTGTIPCAQATTLMLSYDVTDGDESQSFLIPAGGLALIDPQGVVYDANAYDVLVAAGASPDSARTQSAIVGAKVRLQRLDSGVWRNVLAGDPGIAPNINPQTTGADGKYQWDVAAGTYRVMVSAEGFGNVTSAAVVIPPPVLDLHVGLRSSAGAVTPATTTVTTSTTVEEARKLVLRGGKAGDLLRGDSLADRLFGFAGNDRLFGLAGNDRLDGGKGNDRLFGAEGNDVLFGGSGKDRLSGGAGDDSLHGGGGKDRLNGGPGKDVIDAGDGRGGDKVICGAGTDTVKFDKGDKVVGCELLLRA
jgi:Ca2+-binding RTX toxin-like protein